MSRIGTGLGAYGPVPARLHPPGEGNVQTAPAKYEAVLMKPAPSCDRHLPSPQTSNPAISRSSFLAITGSVSIST